MLSTNPGDKRWLFHSSFKYNLKGSISQRKEPFNMVLDHGQFRPGSPRTSGNTASGGVTEMGIQVMFIERTILLHRALLQSFSQQSDSN